MICKMTLFTIENEHNTTETIDISSCIAHELDCFKCNNTFKMFFFFLSTLITMLNVSRKSLLRRLLQKSMPEIVFNTNVNTILGQATPILLDLR